jgi:hypothetical protein
MNIIHFHFVFIELYNTFAPKTNESKEKQTISCCFTNNQYLNNTKRIITLIFTNKF